MEYQKPGILCLGILCSLKTLSRARVYKNPDVVSYRTAVRQHGCVSTPAPTLSCITFPKVLPKLHPRKLLVLTVYGLVVIKFIEI